MFIPFLPILARSGHLSRPPWMGGCVLLLCSVVPQSRPILAATTVEGMLFVCDSNDDRILAYEDLDGSGAIEPDRPGETRVFYDDSSPGPDLSAPSHLLADGDGTLYLLDGGTLDAVLVLVDRNGDGDANDDEEVRTWYSSAGGQVALGTPNTLVRGPDGALYIADDGSAARRIVRLADLNGDGDAEDEGEAAVVYDTTALSPVLPEDLESLAFDGQGVAYVGETTRGAVFRMADANKDGDYLDEEEVRVFYQSGEEEPLQDIDCIAVVGASVIVCDEDSGSIVRLEDRNDDGLIDAASGELSPFLDKSSAVRVRDTNDFTVLSGGVLLVLDGSIDTVFVARDLTGDGDALDDGEVTRWLLDDGESLSTPSGLAFVPRPADDVPHFVRGDVSGDGRLDLTDPIALLGFLFLGESSSDCHDALDADDNGEVNIADAVILLNFLFAGGTAPPGPFPDPGADDTADGLECGAGRPA
jgi:hypothetical protein